MKWVLIVALALAGLVLPASGALALQVGLNDTFTCSSNAECKRKCEARGGRWKRDRTNTTHGTCTLPASISIRERIELLSTQLEQAKAQQRLYEQKRVTGWASTPDATDGLTAVALTPSECAGLGGDVFYDNNCRSGVMCVTEVIRAADAENEMFFQCVDELDGAN